jgi:hypothetical protein
MRLHPEPLLASRWCVEERVSNANQHNHVIC